MMTPAQSKEWFEQNGHRMMDTFYYGSEHGLQIEQFYQAIKSRLIEETTACEILEENRVKE